MSKFAVAGATGRLGRHVMDVLTERGHQAVPMSRATGVDVITGEGLAEALAGVEVAYYLIHSMETTAQADGPFADR